MSLPTTGDFNVGTLNQGQFKVRLEDFLKAVKQIPGAGASEQALTIASGSITPALGASGIIAVDTEAAAATDDLTNIVLTNIDDNSLVFVRNANAARVLVVKHSAGGSGQLSLKSGGDFVLADPDRHWLILKRAGSLLKEVARFPSADLAPILSKSSNYTTTPADRGQLIDCTAALTVSLLANATAGKGFEQCVQNSSLGVVTLDPNGAETIGGQSALKLQPGDKAWIVSDGAAWQIVQRFSAAGGVPHHGHLWGLTVSNNTTDATNDLDIAVGEAMSDDASLDDVTLLKLTAALTGKQIDNVWAAGSGAGMRLSGDALANGTWHIFLFQPATGGVDVFASTSTNPTPPSGTKKRLIQSWIREAGVMIPLTCLGDLVLRTPVQDSAATNPGTSAVTRTLSVPTGVAVEALVNSNCANVGSNVLVLLSPLSVPDQAPSATGAPGYTYFGSNSSTANWGIGGLRILTNTSGQIRSRLSASDANTILYINTIGWIHTRGRDN